LLRVGVRFANARMAKLCRQRRLPGFAGSIPNSSSAQRF
jgi:hypothetical protein